ncbi:MAG: hypothetical protein H0X26_08450 [Alphaproteobacteria bacterium]|nr:hypothetical protein [Alphaproteobacteria bacterium]
MYDAALLTAETVEFATSGALSRTRLTSEPTLSVAKRATAPSKQGIKVCATLNPALIV